mgnify:CR=1 FL=1
MFELDSNNDHVVDFPEFLAKFMVRPLPSCAPSAAYL